MQIKGFNNVESEWATIDEFVARGDGHTREFKLSIPPEELISPEIYIERVALQADAVEVERDLEGKPVTATVAGEAAVVKESAGWAIELRGAEPWLVFDKAPRFNARVGIGVLGRGDGDGVFALRIKSMTQKLRNFVTESGGKVARRMQGNLLATGLNKDQIAELTRHGKAVVTEFTTGWSGVTDDNGNPSPFTPENVITFCAEYRMPVWTLGGWIVKRSGDIAVAELGAMEAEAKNS